MDQPTPGSAANRRTVEHARRLLASQKKSVRFPYFSVVKLDAPRTGAGPFTYTVAQQEVRAFSYGVNQPMTAGGWRGTDGNATFAETNITTPGRTNGGDNLRIFGISVIVTPDSDGFLLQQLFGNVSVAFGVNGDQNLFQLGNLSFLPASGGLMGAQMTNLAQPPLGGAAQVPFYYAQNGVPGRGNFFPLGTIVWRNEGTDSLFTVKLRVERAVAIAGVTLVAAAAGVQGFTPPADGLAFVKLQVLLHSEVIADRSNIA